MESVEILINMCGNLKDFLPADSSRHSTTNTEKKNIGRLPAEVAHKKFDRSGRPRHPELQMPLPQSKTQLR